MGYTYNVSTISTIYKSAKFVYFVGHLSNYYLSILQESSPHNLALKYLYITYRHVTIKMTNRDALKNFVNTNSFPYLLIKL